MKGSWCALPLIVLVGVLAGPVSAVPPTLVINEVHYHPADNSLTGEFVELHNYGSQPVDLEGWFLAGAVQHLFTIGTIIPPDGFLVVAADTEVLLERYALDPSIVVGNYERNLSNQGELLQLWTASGYLASFVDYGDSDPWPETPDGLGPSLERISPLREDPDPQAWAPSIPVGGTPGAVNSVFVDDGDSPSGQSIELIRWGAEWRFFRGGNNPPADWHQLDFDDSSWELGNAGFGYGDGDDTTHLDDMEGNYLQVYLRGAFEVNDLARIETLDLSVDYDDGFVAYLNGVEVTRANVPVGPTHEAGSPEVFSLTSRRDLLQTGANVLAIEGHNAGLTSSDFSLSPSLAATLREEDKPPPPDPLVQPPRDLVVNEVAVGEVGTGWVELYNPTSAPVEVSGRRIVLYPPEGGDYSIPPGPALSPAGTIFVTEADLGFELDAIHALIVVTEEGYFIDGLNPRATNPTHSTGRFPDGADNRVVFSQPTAGEENEMALDQPIVINEIMYHPADDNSGGEYIELFNRSAGPVDLTGWAFSRGITFAFDPSTTVESGGYLVVASDPAAVESYYGITGVLGPYEGALDNSAETVLLRDALGNVADRVRHADEGSWPESADGLGPSLELIHPDLENRYGPAWGASTGEGTPGGPNTRLSAAPLPIVVGVKHSPVIPDSSQVVRVLAEISDDLPINRVTLYHEIDGSGAANLQEMFDDGSVDDGVAGNGIYGAYIPPHPDRTIVAFYIRVEARGSQVVYEPGGSPSNACLYQVEDAPAEAIRPIYRVIMRASNLDALRTRGVNSNTLLDCTIVAAGRAYYNRGIRYRGSSARRCNPLSYRIQFDHDRSLHGIKRLNMNGCSVFRQWIGLDFLRRTGIPTPQAWFRRLSFNGQLEGSWHMRVEAIDGHFLERVLPNDADGNLYRGISQANLDYRGENAGEYRGHYRKDSNEELDDYSDVVDLCYRFDRSTTGDEDFAMAVEERVDVQEWAAYFAAYAILGSSENSILLDNGDDYFLYHRFSDDRWILLPWDLDSCFNQADQRLFRPSEDAISRFLHDPLFAPLYWCHLDYLMETAFDSELVNSRIDHLAPLFPQGQVQALRAYSGQRRAFIAQRLSPVLELTDVSGGSFCRGVIYPNRGTLTLTGRAPACLTSFVLANGSLMSYNVETAVWSGSVDLSSVDEIDLVILNRDGIEVMRETVVVDRNSVDSGGVGVVEQQAGADYVAVKAVQVVRITDPDGDGRVWTEVFGVDGALGSSRSVLRAPDDGNFRETGNSHAVYQFRFRTPGVYRGYYRARGFNRNSDSLWVPDDFNQNPDVNIRTSTGNFDWADDGAFTVSQSHVDNQTVLEFQVGMREFNTEFDALVLSQDTNLNGQQLDNLVQDVANPPRGHIEVMPASEVELVDGGARVTLDGSASHDGQCEVDGLVYLWEKVEGPAGDAFEGDVGAVSVEVLFSAAGTYRYRLNVTSGGGTDTAEASITVLPGSGNTFTRCDADGDRIQNITDALSTLNMLFLQGPEAPCLAAVDCNSDGFMNITDAVFGLNYLFLSGPTPAAPYPDCDIAPAEECAVSTCSQ